MTLRARLRAGEALLATFVKSADPAVAEALASGGLDLLIADLAHSTLAARDVEAIVRAAEVRGVPVLVRIEPADLPLAGRLLETGAAGVQVTDVVSPRQLAAIRAAVAYPPHGARSLSLSHRAAGFGAAPAADVVRRAIEETVVVAQLERRAALDALPALLAADEAPDAWFLGPLDLSADLGHPGQPGHPAVAAAIDGALAALDEAGAVVGAFAGDRAGARAWRARGARLVAVGTDLTLLAAAARGLSTDHPEDG